MFSRGGVRPGKPLQDFPDILLRLRRNPSSAMTGQGTSIICLQYMLRLLQNRTTTLMEVPLIQMMTVIMKPGTVMLTYWKTL